MQSVGFCATAVALRARAGQGGAVGVNASFITHAQEEVHHWTLDSLKDRTAMEKLNRDDRYASYKDEMVQLPDIATYRAAVKSKLVHWVSELAYEPTTQPCAASIIETTLAD